MFTKWAEYVLFKLWLTGVLISGILNSYVITFVCQISDMFIGKTRAQTCRLQMTVGSNRSLSSSLSMFHVLFRFKTKNGWIIILVMYDVLYMLWIHDRTTIFLIIAHYPHWGPTHKPDENNMPGKSPQIWTVPLWNPCEVAKPFDFAKLHNCNSNPKQCTCDCHSKGNVYIWHDFA